MTNFIFKSQGTYKKLCQQLDIIQTELRHQRSDNAFIIRELNVLINNSKLQKQVDDYYGPSDWEKDITAASQPEDRADID